MTTSDSTNPTLGRRNVLRLIGGAAVSGAVLGGASTPVRAQSGTDLDSWFADTSNYDGVVDKTGASSVTVSVGAEANGGPYGFGPAAVRVDPGTTVVWEWTGEGGVHDVTAESGDFGSELVGDAGHTFEHTFDAEGVYTYVCSPHAALGMKGAIVVGSGGGSAADSQSESGGDEQAASASNQELDSWFADTSNFDGVEDQTGLRRVEVSVGAEANGGAFGFGPAAVRVSEGTTVAWTWTGGGGAHNVVAEDGSFESELASDSGHTFEHTFDEAGTYQYACAPHRAMGMKGAVVVESADEAGSHASVAEPFDDPETARMGGTALAGAFGAALASPALFGAFLWLKERTGSGADGERPE